MNTELSHLDSKNNPAMVDVGGKATTLRAAKAQAIVVLGEEILTTLNADELRTAKGPVFQTAIIAGTMAVKKTSDLIPLCHPLAIDGCKIEIHSHNTSEVIITCTIKTEGKTGAEMEALTGASVAALTIYDMCKAMSHGIVIREIKLLEKHGGKSNYDHEVSSGGHGK
ncbi:MAG: cyclic pyranopterin monophosphate synthase MoaC [Rhizobacter sp.]|nr:cyclic pyranopterin monophosphate synthase MoaC [Chlorobiales bacterium]